MKKNLKLMAMICAVVSANLVPAAQAQAQAQAQTTSRPIVGSIDFGGVVTFDTMSLASVKEVMQWNSSFVLQDSGDFTSVSPGSHSTMAPQWIFNSGTPSTPSAGPSTPALWSVGGFTFDLSTSNVLPGQSNNFLHVTGTGTVSSTNNAFQATPGVWSFTVSNSNGQDQTTFGFQANATSVPEAGTISLLAIGLVFLAAATLRKKPAAAA